MRLACMYNYIYSVCTLSEEEIAEIREQCGAIKAEANAFFSSKDYEEAVEKYTVSKDEIEIETETEIDTEKIEEKREGNEYREREWMTRRGGRGCDHCPTLLLSSHQSSCFFSSVSSKSWAC